MQRCWIARTHAVILTHKPLGHETRNPRKGRILVISYTHGFRKVKMLKVVVLATPNPCEVIEVMVLDPQLL